MKIIITENQLSFLATETSVIGMIPNSAAADLGRSIAKKLSKYSLDQFMEDVRSFMGGVAGITIQVLIDGTGVGKFVTVGSWALLTMYDVMKGITKGAWNWLNILSDLAGVILSGPGSKFVKKTLGKIPGATGKLSTFVASIRKLAPNVFNYLSKLVKSFSTVVSKVSSLFTNFINSVSKYLKGTSIYNGLIKLRNGINSSLNKVLTWIEKAFSVKTAKVVKKATTTTKNVVKTSAEDKLTNLATNTVVGGEKSAVGIKK